MCLHNYEVISTPKFDKLQVDSIRSNRADGHIKSTRSSQIEPMVTPSRLDQVRSSRWCHIKSTRSSQIEPMVSYQVDSIRSNRVDGHINSFTSYTVNSTSNRYIQVS